MKILHIVPGTSDVSNGMVVVANQLAKEQADAEVSDLNHGIDRIVGKDIEEVWVHGMWLPKEWAVCRRAIKLGKRLIRMTHGSLSPVYLKCQSPWKKRLVAPIEKCLLRQSDMVVATCEAEKGWIQSYLDKHCPPIEVTDIRRFFKLPVTQVESLPKDRPIHLLYMGRRHSLKGIVSLEEAINGVSNVELRVVSNAMGESKNAVWDWCDCLVLPTLSENFGLVIAEALERNKSVITTDGAPAWGDGNTYGSRLTYIRGYRDAIPAARVAMLKNAVLSLTTNH